MIQASPALLATPSYARHARSEERGQKLEELRYLWQATEKAYDQLTDAWKRGEPYQDHLAVWRKYDADFECAFNIYDARWCYDSEEKRFVKNPLTPNINPARLIVEEDCS